MKKLITLIVSGLILSVSQPLILFSDESPWGIPGDDEIQSGILTKNIKSSNDLTKEEPIDIDELRKFNSMPAVPVMSDKESSQQALNQQIPGQETKSFDTLKKDAIEINVPKYADSKKKNTKDNKTYDNQIKAGKGMNRDSGKAVSKQNGSDSLKLNKKIFETNEKIKLDFTASPLYPTHSWIGMFKADVAHKGMAEADKHDLAWQYLKSKPKGSFNFTAPDKEGNYDFRMFEKNSGSEVVTIKFTVAVNRDIASLKLTKNSFEPNEKIKLDFTASPLYPTNSWIGMFKADVAHKGMAEADKHDLAWQYLKSKPKGSFNFTAPDKEGNYDFRMFEKSSGREVVAIKFTVTK